MVRIMLVLGAVGLVSLIQLPPLLGPKTRRELWVVAALLLISLVQGLNIVLTPEELTFGYRLSTWLEPLGTMLFGPR